jgi:hypothetical protein
MLRILLLDCSASLEQKLKSQGFDVESGTVGLCTGIRRLPSQVYEKDVFVYNPSSIATTASKDSQFVITDSEVTDATPQYSLKHLQSRIEAGATFLVFVNKLSGVSPVQAMLYKWIPFMPSLESTNDNVVTANSFSGYPDSEWKLLSPVVTKGDVALPVLQTVQPPKAQDFPRDVYWLFWNGNGDPLGVLILRGRGRLIVLPRFQSNDSVIETFLHRVVPKIYEMKARTGLDEVFTSPAERASEAELKELHDIGEKIRKREEVARVQLATAAREKSNAIHADPTAKQVMTYYTEARRQPEMALFFLYKIIESIEHKFGGEKEGIAAVGAGAEWKSVKRLANESYRDARHAPKPADVIKPWSETEIRKCFEDTEKVVMAYFATLFPPWPTS